jgi:hypothetical protein
MAVQTQIQIRRGTAAQWTSANPILASGEFGYETDTGYFKIGDGTTAWNTLTVLNGVTASATAVFTNKTLDTAATGNVLKINGTQVTAVTGTGAVVLETSPTLTTPALGTPSSATLTNATGLPVASGISGLGTGVATALAVNVGSAGAPVVNGGALGTPSSGTLTSATGLPLTTGVTGTLPVANGGTGITSLGTGVATWLGTPTSANLRTVVADETGGGVLVFNDAPTLTGTVTASGIINMTATGGFGNLKDYQTLNLMGCL